MNSQIKVLFLIIPLLMSSFLQAQFDPSVMASLSKLPKEDKARLIKQYGSGHTPSTISEQNLNEKRNLYENDEIVESSKIQERQNNPSENLREMEEQISEDIVRLEVSLDTEISEIEINKIQDALRKSKVLLAKIKELQRLEIQNYTQELELISSSIDLLPFGYDIFANNPSDSSNYGSPIPLIIRWDLEI